MTMQYDVSNVHANATGELIGYPTRVKTIVITSTGGGAGTVLLTDGGAGGPTKIEVDVPNSATFHNIFIPGEGVRFNTNVYATLTNCYISVFYG